MKSLELLSEHEAEDLMSFYFSQAVPFKFGVLSNGKPAFMLKKNTYLVKEHGSFTWNVREIGLGLHSFIELVTGEQKKKKIYIALCLVNPQSRRYLKLLLDTTRSLEDGRYNSQPAQFYVLTKEGRGFIAKVKLENLCMHHIMLQLMPSGFTLRYKSPHCPFCRQLGGIE